LRQLYLGQTFISTKMGVCGQTHAAGIGFRHSYGDALSQRGWQHTIAQSTKVKVAVEGSR
jgi:hypothetical protein